MICQPHARLGTRCRMGRGPLLRMLQHLRHSKHTPRALRIDAWGIRLRCAHLGPIQRVWYGGRVVRLLSDMDMVTLAPFGLPLSASLGGNTAAATFCMWTSLVRWLIFASSTAMLSLLRFAHEVGVCCQLVMAVYFPLSPPDSV